MTTRVEVRCCCDPGRLLGWLDVPDAALRNSTFTVPLRLVNGNYGEVQFELGTVLLPPQLLFPDWPAGEHRSVPAYKAPHLPIETLRRVRGFVEAEP